ncbi:transposable element Tc1 transposase [Trichonephila clavipes]|nr:transposable element Tc1 transposase [Trichonephila clavipes]
MKTQQGGPVPTMNTREKHYIKEQERSGSKPEEEGVNNKMIRRKKEERIPTDSSPWRRPAACVPLTSSNRRVRYAESRQHRNWCMNERVTVLFTDESRFTLNTDFRRTFIWREPGTRYLPSNVHEIDNYGKVSLMVWVGIMWDGRTSLHIFESGSEFILMDDNTKPHRALLVDEFLESEDINCMDWPSRSPDLNSVERCVLDSLQGLGRSGEGSCTSQPPPRTLQEMKTALMNEWDNCYQNFKSSRGEGPRLVFGSALEQLKAALPEAFPAIQNRKDLEGRFYASQQRRNQEPTDFAYDLLKSNKKLELVTSEKVLIDNIFVRLEPQVQDCVEIRNPQNTVQLLEVYRAPHSLRNTAIKGSRNSHNVERRGWNKRRMSNVDDNRRNWRNSEDERRPSNAEIFIEVTMRMTVKETSDSKAAGRLIPIVSNYPNEIVALDLLGPYPTSRVRSNKGTSPNQEHPRKALHQRASKVRQEEYQKKRESTTKWVGKERRSEYQPNHISRGPSRRRQLKGVFFRGTEL